MKAPAPVCVWRGEGGGEDASSVEVSQAVGIPVTVPLAARRSARLVRAVPRDEPVLWDVALPALLPGEAPRPADHR